MLLSAMEKSEEVKENEKNAMVVRMVRSLDLKYRLSN